MKKTALYVTPKKNRIRLSPGDKIFSAICHAVVIIIAFLCFYPLWYVFINSIATGAAAREGVYIFPMPGQFYLETYKSVLTDGSILSGMRVSSARVVISTVLCVTFSALFAYLTTRPQLPFRQVIYRFAIVSMYVSGGLIPWFVMMRAYGLSNNFAVYIVPGMLSMWFVILIRAYMDSSIPAELEEAARMDGAGHLIVFFRIFMPLCKPILATCALFNAVGAWNAWFDNFLLVTDPNLQTVQVTLFNFIREAESMTRTLRMAASAGIGTYDIMQDMIQNMTSDNVRNTTTIVTMFPIMMIFPFLQKFFASGIMMGAVKG
jgi:ABC-type glycerol-3-phosphate transport system permease component